MEELLSIREMQRYTLLYCYPEEQKPYTTINEHIGPTFPSPTYPNLLKPDLLVIIAPTELYYIRYVVSYCKFIQYLIFYFLIDLIQNYILCNC